MLSLETWLTNEVVQLNAMIVALQDQVGYLEGEEIPSLECRLVELERRIPVPFDEEVDCLVEQGVVAPEYVE